MNGNTFVATVKELLCPTLEPLGFVLHSSVSGRMYLAEFVSPTHVASISFEPGDDYLLVVIFTVDNGERSELDDRNATPRLSDLNRRFLSASDAQVLHDQMLGRHCEDADTGRLAKAARELAVVLPRYLAAH
jgi:hypothetical protein